MNLPAPLAIVVELYLAGAWVDISDDVYGDRDIDITRGSGDWSPDVQPGSCKLKLKNKTGKYSPHNPLGPYYGKLGRNVPLRVSVEGNYRFLGEVSEWPLRAAPNLFVDIEASGVLRRLSKSDSDEHSAFHRGLMRPVNPLVAPAGYWPCENVDNNDAILAADARRGTPLVVNKSTTGLGTSSGFLGSDQIITLNDSQVYADVPTIGASGTNVLVGALVRLPDNGVAANSTPIMTVNTAGTAAYWRIRANTDGTLSLQVADPFTDGGLGGVITTYGNTTWSIAGRTAFVALTLEQSSGNVTWNLFAWTEYGTTGLQQAATLTSRTFNTVTRQTFGSGFNAGATAIGHIAAWAYNSDLPPYIQNLVNGYRGERAAVRAGRIAQEEGIVLALRGSTASSLPMIQQGVKSGLELLMDAVEADGGVLYEPPDVPTRVLADAEDGTTGSFTGGSATLAVSTTQAHSGTSSVRATWNTSSGEMRAANQNYFVVGVTYTFSAWVYVPAGNPTVKLAILGGASSSLTTVTDQWQKLSVTWTATTYTYLLQVLPTAPSAGQLCYVDDATLSADRAGLHFVPLVELYNQTADLTLDYDDAEIHDIESTDDDRYLTNDVSVSVEGFGDPARYSLDTGLLSTAAPPNGAGRYSTSVTRNVLTGELAYNWARWLVHVGTFNDPRYPKITVNLNRKRALIAGATALEPGSLLVGENAPDWLPPQDIRQLVFGLSETINVRTWKIDYDCAPGRPFDVFRLDEDRLATESTLASGVTTSGTSLSVTSTAAGGRWETAGIFPFNIMVASVEGMIGEEMTVTAISGAGLTQTFTVTRGVNGVAVAWSSGSAVFLSRRPTLALGP